MTEEDIIGLVRKSFDNNIRIKKGEFGHFIGGEKDFYEELLVKLKQLFDDNDLSKF